MKNLLLVLSAFLITACSNNDDNTNNSASNTDLNPPSWIQGYWLLEIDSSTGEVTDLSGLKATNDDFYQTQLGSGTSLKMLIKNTIQSGGEAIVNEYITNSEYKLNVKLNGTSLPQYHYKKISPSKIRYFDTAGNGGSFFNKQ